MSDMTCVDCGLELAEGYMIHESCFEEMLKRINKQADQIAMYDYNAKQDDTIIEKLRTKVDQQAERIKELKKEVQCIHETADEIEELLAENQRLKEFAKVVIRTECWGYPDGGGIQELAEQLGLIKLHTATEDDVNEFTYFEVGDTIYKLTDILAAQPQKGPDNEANT